MFLTPYLVRNISFIHVPLLTSHLYLLFPMTGTYPLLLYWQIPPRETVQTVTGFIKQFSSGSVIFSYEILI